MMLYSLASEGTVIVDNWASVLGKSNNVKQVNVMQMF